MPNHCPECGGPMLMSRRDERPDQDAPAATATDPEVRDLAAEDVRPEETRAVKAAMLICGQCGAQLATPDP